MGNILVEKKKELISLNQSMEIDKFGGNYDSYLMKIDKAIALCQEIKRLSRNYNEIKLMDENIRTYNANREKMLGQTGQKMTNVCTNSAKKDSVNKDKNNGEKGSSNDDENDNNVYFKKEPPKVTLKDVAGLANVKNEIIMNVLSPLKDPELYYEYKDEAGCTILMYGPPGCGKTFVATAIAGELQCAYAVIDVSDVLDKYVGEAPKKIKAIFEEASKFDNCLLFFDELDALFASRDSEDSRNTKDLLNAFLTSLSGFNSSNDKKSIRVIIGATNRPWALDSALTRGKRFDTHIYVTLPDYEARLFLINKEFKNHSKLLSNTDITAEEMADRLEGYSGADICSILGKVRTKAFEKAKQNKERGIEGIVPISKQFFDEVFASYRNSITKEDLKRFEDFRNGKKVS